MSDNNHQPDTAKNPPDDVLIARCTSCGRMFPRSNLIDGVCGQCPQRERAKPKFALTEADLPYLRALLDKMGLAEGQRDDLLRSIEVVSEQAVAATEHVEVDLGGEAHLQYLAKITDELFRGMDRWIPGHEYNEALPDPGTNSSGAGPAGWGGSGTDIMMEIWKAAKELGKSNPGDQHEPPKKQKVIHHPGKQWLDPGWHEKR